MNVDPEDIDGSYYGGAYEGRWRVYEREGEGCLNCSTRIRGHARGRSTYFCPRARGVEGRPPLKSRRLTDGHDEAYKPC